MQSPARTPEPDSRTPRMDKLEPREARCARTSVERARARLLRQTPSSISRSSRTLSWTATSLRGFSSPGIRGPCCERDRGKLLLSLLTMDGTGWMWAGKLVVAFFQWPDLAVTSLGTRCLSTYAETESVISLLRGQMYTCLPLGSFPL